MSAQAINESIQALDNYFTAKEAQFRDGKKYLVLTGEGENQKLKCCTWWETTKAWISGEKVYLKDVAEFCARRHIAHKDLGAHLATYNREHQGQANKLIPQNRVELFERVGTLFFAIHSPVGSRLLAEQIEALPDQSEILAFRAQEKETLLDEICKQASTPQMTQLIKKVGVQSDQRVIEKMHDLLENAIQSHAVSLATALVDKSRSISVNHLIGYMKLLPPEERDERFISVLPRLLNYYSEGQLNALKASLQKEEVAQDLSVPGGAKVPQAVSLAEVLRDSSDDTLRKLGEEILSVRPSAPPFEPQLVHIDPSAPPQENVQVKSEPQKELTKKAKKELFSRAIRLDAKLGQVLTIYKMLPKEFEEYLVQRSDRSSVAIFLTRMKTSNNAPLQQLATKVIEKCYPLQDIPRPKQQSMPMRKRDMQ